MSTTDRCGTKHILCLIVVCLAATLVCATAIAFTVRARQVAATLGDPNYPWSVWETHVAANADTAIAVFHWGDYHFSPGKKIAYSVGTFDPNADPNQPWEWEEKGPIPQGADYGDSFDPTVGYDPTSGKFIAAANAYNETAERGEIAVAFYDPNDVSPGFGDWQFVCLGTDKPWLIVGEKTIWGRELYIVGWHNTSNCYRYARSVDGGQTWYSRKIRVSGSLVRGIFCAQPTCRQRATEPNEPTYDPNEPNAPFQGDPIYIAYRYNNSWIRFLKGTDDNSDPCNPKVTFEYLMQEHGLYQPLGGPEPTPAPGPLTVVTRAARVDITRYVPGGFKVMTTPWLVVDPTMSNSLYLVYQDIIDGEDPNCVEDPTECDVDIDIFVRKLTKDSDPNAYWEKADPERVNQDTVDPNDPNKVDQFTPTVVIDKDGKLHIIYYDERRWPGQPDQGASDEKFDMYYAMGIEDNGD